MKIRQLGQSDYLQTWQAMRAFTDSRTADTADELWLVEHPPVFTQGQTGKPEHLHNPGNIPVVQSDRGGQITYHGPGQIVLYTLLDLRRYQLNIRQLVSLLENTVINLLATYEITGNTRCKAPGVYVDNKKICSVGLRIRNHCAYHGLAFNVAMDLEPFSRINPCGFTQLPITQLADLAPEIVLADVQTGLIEQCSNLLARHVREASVS